FQVAGLAKFTAAYLRADADLLDASRKDDIAIRRLALEKRAKIAIDAEVARLQAEKDSRAVLSADQKAKLEVILDIGEPGMKGKRQALWTPLVAPATLGGLNYALLDSAAVPSDSNLVRFRVIPSFAEI